MVEILWKLQTYNLGSIHSLSLLNQKHILHLLMTLLCHDKVYCSTRELRDEPIPVVSDHPFFLKTSRKTPRNLTKLRHWLPLQRPVNLSDLLHGVFYHLKLLGKGSKNPAHQRYTFPASRSRIPERCYILRTYEECIVSSSIQRWVHQALMVFL